MFGFNGSMHSHFLASSGDDEGFYTTIEENEVISFSQNINCIEFFAKETSLKIKINNDPGIFHIPAGTRDGITGLPMNRFIVTNLAGTKIKWRALVSIENT